MNIVRPLGNPHWAPFILRVVVGFYFILLALYGLSEPEQFKHTLEAFAGVNGALCDIYCAIGPTMILLVGALLVFGLFTVPAALLSGLLFLPLFYTAGTFESGTSLQMYVDRRVLYKDLVVFVANISLVFTGPGVFSLDGVLSSIYGSASENIVETPRHAHQ